MAATAAAFSQFRAGSVSAEHKGRTATLKAVAYCTGDPTTDTRNNRHYHFNNQQDNERILMTALFIPKDAPEGAQREQFPTLAAQQQAVWTSLAEFEEKQRYQHAGRGGYDGKPIISRHDVVLLDKRLFLDAEGKPRPDGLNNLKQVMTDFIRENYSRKGLVASFSIHDQTDKNGNFHAHIVSSYRTLTHEGWGERQRPYGRARWAIWVKQRAISLKNIQSRKLERLGVVDRAAQPDKRATLAAWKTARGYCSYRYTQAPQRQPSKAAPCPANQSRRPHQQPATGGHYGQISSIYRDTKDSTAAYIKLCQNPLHDLCSWLDTQGRSRPFGDYLLAEPRDGLAGNDRVQPIPAERPSGYNPVARPARHYAGMLGDVPTETLPEQGKSGDGKTGKGEGSAGGMMSALSALRFTVLHALHQTLGQKPAQSSGGGNGMERRRVRKWVAVERRTKRPAYTPAPHIPPPKT